MSKTNANESDGTPPSLGTVLRWLAATAGLSGLLATAGYIVHFAQEDLLGVGLDTRSSAAAFVLDGARFFADLGMFLLRAAPDLIVALVLVAVLVLLAIGYKLWRERRKKREAPWKQVPARAYLILLLLAIFGELAWYDLPMMYIQDVLFKPVEVGSDLEVSQSLPQWVQHRTVALRNSIVCSRAELQNCPGDINAHKRFLERWFSFNLVFTLFLLILGLRALTPPLSPESRSPNFPSPIFSPLGIFLSLTLLLNLFSIPFVYAKTIKPTRFLSAEIVFKTSTGAEKVEKTITQSTTNEQPQTPPEGGTPNNERELSMTHWYILSEGPDRLTLYNEDETQIWSIPKDDLHVIEIVGEGDVLETHFLEWGTNQAEEGKDDKKT